MKRSLWISSPLAVAGVFASAAFFGATDASAFEFGSPATDHPFRSAQNFELELRLSASIFVVAFSRRDVCVTRWPFVSSSE